MTSELDAAKAVIGEGMEDFDRPLALRLTLHGACPLHDALLAGFEQFGAEIQALAAQAGVTGTPHLFVNGTPLNISAYVTSARQADLAAFERTITTGTVSTAQTDTSLPTIKD